jgi:O-glycosyl hydrolase
MLSFTAGTAPIPIRIDASTTYQTIDHFGASDCWSFQKIGEWDVDRKERVADLLFSPTDGIGLSGWRFNIGGGINTETINHPWRTVETFEVSEGVYDWTRQAEERWFLHAAQERGVEEFIAFVNSPPGRMTRNGYTNCTENLGSTNLKPGYEGQFARYLADILKFFRDDEGILFDHISPVNEPQWEWNRSNQEGNRASNADIIAIVKALYDELQNQDLETEISICESGAINAWHQLNSGMTSKYKTEYGNYLDELIGNPEISDKIGKHFGGHSYWSDRLTGQLVEHRAAARPYFTEYFDLGWKYWATEYCILDGPEGEGGNGRDLKMETALNVARVIHHDLVYLNASAWSWWTAVSPENYKDGLIYTNYKDNPASPSIIESRTLWALGNFSRYIRPGAKRIKLSGANNKLALMGSAYINKQKDQIIIVFVNVADKTIDISASLSGLETGKTVRQFTPFITSDEAGHTLKEEPAVLSGDDYAIPARSIVTLVGQIEDETKVGSHKHNAPEFSNLLRAYPNPFNKSIKIKYELEAPSDIELNVFNSIGQKVNTLFAGRQDAGSHVLAWDAVDAKGRELGSGVYFCSLVTNDQMDTIKLILAE